MHDVRTKLPLSRFLLTCATLNSLETTVLDTDAFYSSNMDRLVDGVSPPEGDLMLLPEQDFEATSLVTLLSSRRQMLIVDDINSLYSLASDSLRLQQLTIILRMLSYNARSNNSWVISTAYRTELDQRKSEANQRLLTASGNLLVDTEFRDGSLKLRPNSGHYWPDGEFSV